MLLNLYSPKTKTKYNIGIVLSLSLITFLTSCVNMQLGMMGIAKQEIKEAEQTNDSHITIAEGIEANISSELLAKIRGLIKDAPEQAFDRCIATAQGRLYAEILDNLAKEALEEMNLQENLACVSDQLNKRTRIMRFDRLLQCSKCQFIKSINFLLELGYDINETNGSGGTILVCNILDEDTKATEFLLEHTKAKLTNEEAKNEGTIFDLLPNLELKPTQMKLLVKAGVDINQQDPISKSTFLHKAANFLNTSLMVALLEAGAKATIHDRMGKTALDILKERLSSGNYLSIGNSEYRGKAQEELLYITKVMEEQMQ